MHAGCARAAVPFLSWNLGVKSLPERGAPKRTHNAHVMEKIQKVMGRYKMRKEIEGEAGVLPVDKGGVGSTSIRWCLHRSGRSLRSGETSGPHPARAFSTP